MKVLFEAEVCWDWDGNTGTYLDLIVFDRGNGTLEVVRTARKNWQEALEQGTIKAAEVPSNISENNVEEIIYEKEYLLPLIG